ncbi:hypothetical protein F383_29897 [Gossypium arboreum]|uniref:Uncharacterized protein n=1 Tax=Gossypium arboreum TaxID=29729 RepID=A0A0B0MQM9_GOSAR|nr:hypothetical protein F383_29897 [Gossypium arboreum]
MSYWFSQTYWLLMIL